MRFAYSDSGYARLGLTGNPFVAEAEPGVVPELWIARAGVPPPPQPAHRTLVQLIGPKGAGKTSHLLRWREAAPGPYHYVPPGRGRWRRPPIAPLVYWDEADRMAAATRRWALRQAFRRGATVVAGTHEDLSGVARASGLEVVTYEFPALSPAALQAWSRLRIEAVALPGRTSTLVLDPVTARDICLRAGASLRDAAVDLHIWAAERAAARQAGAHAPVDPGE
ncbi:hypothetical protein [Granulicoccus sp. GXG6511]|uniref:hypothetical protein n=1 Tax=Granulicoccus sp. GXG6511 TaxID=3381351 RepID=UPI003D7CA7A2